MRTAEDKHKEEIYVNVVWTKNDKPAPQKRASTLGKLKGNFVSVSLGLLSFLLLVGLVVLAIVYGRLVRHSWDVETNLTQTEDLTAERDSLITNLTQHLQTSRDQLTAMTQERDSLITNLTEQSRELERLRAASVLNGLSPDRWTSFSSNYYLLSTQTLSWDKAREFCISEGADLVTINDAEEQRFVSEWITSHTWIGLNDREQEGTWRWVKDNSPLTQGFWSANQPDHGSGREEWGEEDCVHIEGHTRTWNDRRCNSPMNFMCERNA